MHDLAPFPDKNFDLSHTINGLAFGRAYPGMKNPLDGVAIEQRNERNPSGATGMFQYFLRVVRPGALREPVRMSSAQVRLVY